MNHFSTHDRASAKADAPEAATAPADQPAGRGPTPASAVEPEATEAAADPWDSDEYDALVAAGLRAPNMREFTLDSAYAWSLFRPEPSMLPQIPLLRHNPVVRNG